MQPIYAFNPPARFSLRHNLDRRLMQVLACITDQPRTLPELAQMLNRSQTAIFLDLNWLAQHAFVLVQKRRRVHD